MFKDKRDSKFKRKNEGREEVFTPSVVKGKKRVLEAKDLWIDYFSDIIGCLMGDDPMDKATVGWMETVIKRAAFMADEALKETEQRFPGL